MFSAIQFALGPQLGHFSYIQVLWQCNILITGLYLDNFHIQLSIQKYYKTYGFGWLHITFYSTFAITNIVTISYFVG